MQITEENVLTHYTAVDTHILSHITELSFKMEVMEKEVSFSPHYRTRMNNIYDSLDIVSIGEKRTGSETKSITETRFSSTIFWLFMILLFLMLVTTIILLSLLTFYSLPQAVRNLKSVIKEEKDSANKPYQQDITLETYSSTVSKDYIITTSSVVTPRNDQSTSSPSPVPKFHTTETENAPVVTSCSDILRLRKGVAVDGVYSINSLDKPIDVYCDMSTAGGGWTLIQRRFDGSVNFYKSWNDYKQGFGIKRGEHWLGNRFIHELTKERRQILRIELLSVSDFSIGNETEKYTLSLGEYSGNAGDTPGLGRSFKSYHNGIPFSTRDQDNDPLKGDCGNRRFGGWWFNYCAMVYLNGLHNNPLTANNPEVGIYWAEWTGKTNGSYIIKTEMKVKDND